MRFDRSFSQLTTQELFAIVQLRINVFVVEQHCAYPELDSRDQEPATRHVWIQDDESLIAYLRLLDNGQDRCIGRVVTSAAYRRSGHASDLMGYVLGISQAPWTLDAQSHLVRWYEQHGFVVSGDEFDDFGIAHTPMRRESY